MSRSLVQSLSLNRYNLPPVNDHGKYTHMKLSYCIFQYRSKCTKRLLWKSAQTLQKNVNMNLQVSCIHAGLSLIEWLAPLSHKMCCKDTYPPFDWP